MGGAAASRPFLGSYAVDRGRDAFLMSTMGAAEERAAGLHAVAYDGHTAMIALGRQRMDGAFETIEDMRLTLHSDFKALIVYVPAYFTPRATVPLCCSHVSHCLPLSLTVLARRLCFPDVLTAGTGLRRGRFGTLGDIPARFGFETVPADMDRSGA